MTNRNSLKNEISPYLIQHSFNPVDWYPWGDEAFSKAEEEDKPIFLSIGYSTCHWCHVMEEESFMDDKVAELMNETFINIKVDREERPDIDGVYMAVSQMLTGGGGWPLTIIMTPDKKPFYAATYIPKESSFGRVGMLDLIPQIKNYWDNQRDRLRTISENLVHNLKERVVNNGELSEEVFETAFLLFDELYDEENGGFNGAPKFPAPHNLLYLLRYWKRTGNSKALKMVEGTLIAMRKGGIFDQIGYGFHRYSTDKRWIVPHFEKMLYDQAMLIMAYTEAYQATNKSVYKIVAEETIAYVLRDLTSPYGGFYSAEDADSEGEEGKFYLWTIEELEDALSDEEFTAIIDYFNIRVGGNYLDESTRQKTGKNIPFIQNNQEENETITSAKNKLFLAREKRIRPLLDDKILTDWNGLMVAALSKAGNAFQSQEYIEEAVRAVDFILGKMWDGSTLLHRFREDEAGIQGYLNDYSFIVWALIELYQATQEIRFYNDAVKINNVILEKFRDPKGGFYFTSEDSEKLLIRRKELYDGAIPSGNSIEFYNLVRLSHLKGDVSLEKEADKLLKYFANKISGQPQAYSMFLSGLDFAIGPSSEIVITGKKDAAMEIISKLSKEYIPNKVIHIWSKELSEKIPYLSIYKPTDTTEIYVCSNFECNLPTSDYKEALRQIKMG